MDERVEKAIWNAFVASACWPDELKGVTWGSAKLIAASGNAPFAADYLEAIKSMATAARSILSPKKTPEPK